MKNQAGKGFSSGGLRENMRNMTRFHPALCCVLVCAQLPAQQPAPRRNDDPSVIRTTSQEVLLDIVVRDKKGRLVKDLRPDEVEINDDGAVQKLRSFRLVSGGEVIEGAPKEASAPAPARRPLDPLRQIRVVTLVFEGLGTEGRKNARQAALDFLKTNEQEANIYYGVFSADQRLSVLQQYSPDAAKVRAAVNKATGSSYSLFADESAKIATELSAEAAMDQAAATPTVGSSGAPSDGQKGAMVSSQMAQMTLNMLQFSQAAERTQQSRASIDALLALVRAQNRLPGRKTMLYFTEGLTVAPELKDRFEYILDVANRANVTVYTLDSRGLITSNANSAGESQMRQASRSSARTATQRNGPVTPDQAQASDLAEASTRANVQNSLSELAEKTGGFMIANSNDLRTPLRRISEEVGSYYEAAYSPQIDKLDGAFRKIAVRVTRPDVRVQTRNGYHALPYVEGQPLMGYEVPMLTALSSTPMPRDIAYRSSTMRYRDASGSAASEIVLDLPFQSVTFTKDAEAKVFRVHFSVLCLIKDANGTVVEKFSQDVPLQRPMEEYDGARAGHFIYTKHLTLAPGRYTIETAVLDRESLKSGAKRQSLIAGEGKGLGISSLSAVRSFAQRPSVSDPDDLFEFAGGKVTPGLDDTIKIAPGSELALYFVIYRDVSAAGDPKLALEFLQDGKLVARGEPQLPAADAQGRIPYIARSPLASFKPGQYEVRATVSQSGKTVQDKTFLNLE